jgi:hypothetical protein
VARLPDVADVSLQLAHHEGQSVPRSARAVRASELAGINVPADLSACLAHRRDADKGIGYLARDGITSADYPRLGRFPTKRETWYRFLKPTGRGKDVGASATAVVKYGYKYRQSSLLPGITLIGRPSGDYFTCRWVTPIDKHSNLFYSFSMFRRRGPVKDLLNSVFWLAWLSWAHDWLFSEQDRRLLEGVIPGEELLSRSDIGVVAWRRYVVAHARRPHAVDETERSAAE